jgi:hypothetical protein
MKHLSTIALMFILLTACSDKDKHHRVLTKEQEAEVTAGNIQSFNEDELTPVDYVAWIRDAKNGLLQEKKMEELVFSAQYKPYAYVTCMEEKKKEIQGAVLKEKISELEGMQYIDFKIALTDGQGELLKHQVSGPGEYNARINYFAFGMQHDISLVDGTDTIPCSLFHFERAYDVTPYSTFLLGFNKGAKKGVYDKTLIFQDKTFHKGTIKLSFRREDLLNTPKLKTT